MMVQSNAATARRRVQRNQTRIERVPVPRGQLEHLPVDELSPDPRNPRKHDREQIRAIARSIETFGFNAPILIDKTGRILCGHGRFAAAQLLGQTHVPVIRLDHLSEAQARAYMLADNKLTDRSSWDDGLLAVHLKELSELALDFSIEDAVRGCLEWQQNGLGSCEAVRSGTDRWRGFADHVKQFVAAECELDDSAIVEASSILNRYRAWCAAHGEKPLSAAGLKTKLIGFNLTHKRPRGRSQWLGIRLK